MIKRYFYKSIRLFFTRIAKHLLFLPSPDTIHKQMISITSFFGQFWMARKFVSVCFGRNKNNLIRQKLHEIEFASPVGLAAGFDKNGEVVPMMASLGFGFSTVGSVTVAKCKGNPKPWFYRLPKTKSLVVNAGLANAGSSVIIQRLGNFGSKIPNDFPVVLSVAKTNSQKAADIDDAINDYVISITRAKTEDTIKMVEINISCPNAYGGEPFTTPERLDRLLTAVDRVDLKKPITIKMPVDLPWSDFKKLLEVIISHKIPVVTIANLAKDRTKVNLKDDLADSVKGNLSGKPTFDLSNDLIRQTYKYYGKKLTIIGVGGIFTPEDAYKKIRLGASLVEVLTGMIFCGPQLAAEINKELPILLKRDGFDCIADAIGVDAR